MKNIEIKAKIAEILRAESEAILNLPITDGYGEAVALIVEQVHHKGHKLVTSGMGKAGQIAMNIATTFSSTGIPATFLHPSEAQHGDLGVVQQGDVMLVISNSGKTREIVELLHLTRQLHPDTPFIVITGAPHSELAQLAHICLDTGAPTEVCPLGLTPTTSTTMMTIIGDILVVNTMLATGFDTAAYAKRHHGGYLGVLAREQELQ